MLSTQYIVDCMKQDENPGEFTSCDKGTSVNGCCGGNAGDAMRWLTEQARCLGLGLRFGLGSGVGVGGYDYSHGMIRLRYGYGQG